MKKLESAVEERDNEIKKITKQKDKLADKCAKLENENEKLLKQMSEAEEMIQSLQKSVEEMKESASSKRTVTEQVAPKPSRKHKESVESVADDAASPEEIQETADNPKKRAKSEKKTRKSEPKVKGKFNSSWSIFGVLIYVVCRNSERSYRKRSRRTTSRKACKETEKTKKGIC